MDTTPSTPRSEQLTVHAHRLRLLVRHLAGPAIRARVEPEDIVQEVYLRALKAPLPAAAAEDAAQVWAFLAHLARHVVIDIARAGRAARRDGKVVRLARTDWSRFDAADPAAQTPGPATRVAAAETQALLEAAFDQLSGDHRRVLGLRQFEGLSAADTGRRMGRSEAAVHSLYRRALAAWEQALPASHRSGEEK